MSDAPTSAEELQARAGAVLANYDVNVRVEGGGLDFTFDGALCSLRGVNLAPGLDVLTLTSVLAWDRPLKAQLHKKVADRNAELQFGSITVITRGQQADVMLRYTFPAAGLDDEALATMLLLVLSGVARARKGLVP
ncbi:YbjN domain-containing protein [Nocardia yamanashiensis]|uniref:YbjN domain-containing protein n=1 Tax=Nocardia yamanashiensis TaxID=209247 RepID=UPI00082D5F49|nr:YbjN domain-containing protein [Nocardia yamanashiensis]UGT45273.1 YbjN domain-containing protein [Nocardia yamanashiensis]